ncbi:putative uncharacterized protein DDB_G0287457 isoform X1 [Bicyclus anynana]|uniref:Uncharacterized protein n=1 Tax=Bicyclus anynana TaxID=110368 RepID=A0A6J1NXY2_BICAN|nr:putative uncharacterized protein DDB_G0287457 isoform X1 [Bicyclus anynana]
MNYSSIFVFLVSLLSSSNVYSMRYNDPLNNMYNNQPYGNSNQEVVNIGNGVNRRNFVILEDNSNYPNTRGQPDQTGYRYGGSSSVNNIGNGVNNHNTVVLDGGSDGGRQYESWNNGGTTVVRNRNNGKDIFNVGYGQGNQNRVSIDGRPVQTDCYGSSCGNIPMAPRRVSNAAATNQILCVSLVLSLSFIISTLF